MTYRFLLLLVIVGQLAACSTFRTNTKTSFDSIHLSGQKPVIHVGDISEKPDQLTLLGWVDASVTQARWFGDKPTQAQVDIILAEQGEALGADAVIYVTYSSKSSASLLTKLEARGQAVRLKNRQAILISTPTPQKQKTIEPTAVSKKESTKAIIKAESIIEKIPPTLPMVKKELPNAISESLPTTVEEVIKINSTEVKADAPPVSLMNTVIEKSKAPKVDIAPVSCEPTINDIVAYEANIDSINFMIMNTEFLLKKARSIKDKEMESASSRLMYLLEQQLEKAKKEKPITTP